MNKQEKYVSIWGDTVIFKRLLIGLIFGAVLGYVSFISYFSYLKMYHADLSKSLLNGYALLAGIGGCIIAAIIIGKIFKPKRIFHNEIVNIDKQKIFNSLEVDVRKEAEYLKDVSPLVITEMKELHLYEMFVNEDTIERRPK